MTRPRTVPDGPIYSEKPSNKDTAVTMEALKKALGKSSDVVFKSFYINRETGLSATLLFIDGLVDNDLISKTILKPLLECRTFPPLYQATASRYLQIR